MHKLQKSHVSLGIKQKDIPGIVGNVTKPLGNVPIRSITIEPYIRRTPLTWIQRAGALRGKALATGVAIWYRSGLEKSPRVRLPASILREFGVGRYSGYRALRALESAGLVKVERHRGRCPVVEIIPQDELAQGGPDRNNQEPGTTPGVARANSGPCSGREKDI